MIEIAIFALGFGIGFGLGVLTLRRFYRDDFDWEDTESGERGRDK